MLRITNYKKNKCQCYNNQDEKISRNLIKNAREIVKKRLSVGFGCGLQKKYFNEKELKYLREITKNNINFLCDANSGKFDIDIDLSFFRCFPKRKEKNKKIYEFNDYKEIFRYLKRK